MFTRQNDEPTRPWGTGRRAAWRGGGRCGGEGVQRMYAVGSGRAAGEEQGETKGKYAGGRSAKGEGTRGEGEEGRRERGRGGGGCHGSTATRAAPEAPCLHHHPASSCGTA